VDEFWSFEAVQHGDSALVNANNLSGMWDIADGGRDIIHFLSFYLPDSISQEPLPTHLPRLPDSVANVRLSTGFTERSIVAIGHSIGSSCVTFAVTTHSSLFSSLYVIDPVIFPTYIDTKPAITALIHHSLTRRTEWPSLASARSSIATEPFFRTWHPEILDVYLQTALYKPDPASERVALKTPAVHEAVVCESKVALELWELIATLDERVRIRWVVTAHGGLARDAVMTRSLVWRRSGNASNVIFEAGHMIPQEQPFEVATDLFEFVKSAYGTAPSARL
jgi:pimeloyl-ACP methyl ester carboxylesterase